MARMTKAQKAIETQTDEAFRVYCNRVTIPIMKLGTVLNLGRKGFEAGKDMETVGAEMKALALSFGL